MSVDTTQSKEPRKKAGADKEVWIQDQINTAMRMAIALHRAQNVGADAPAFEYALRGVAEGAAYEVIYTLGLEPSFINIRPFRQSSRMSREVIYHKKVTPQEEKDETVC